MNELPRNIPRWLVKAQNDELSAESLLKHKDGSFSVAGFLCQQMVEKLLKALLIFREVRIRKIHDLLELQRILLVSDPDIVSLESELTLLNEYYTEARYPGDIPELTYPEAERAFDAANKVKDFVHKKLGV